MGEAVRQMVPVVRFRGLTLDRPTVVLDALFIWRDHPRLGFVDALGAAHGRQPNTQLATFDAGLDRVVGITRYDLATG